jgi:hypothetical protein
MVTAMVTTYNAAAVAAAAAAAAAAAGAAICVLSALTSTSTVHPPSSVAVAVQALCIPQASHKRF